MIKCKKMNYTYQDNSPFARQIFKDVDISINGEKILILGASGSGKSTFFKILTNYIKVSERELEKPQEIALVMQNVNSQIVTETVFEEINLGYEQKFNKKISKEIIMEYFKQFAVDFNLDDNPRKLSGGQKKIMMIISIIAMEPDMIIFDEPFVGLDLKHQRLVRSFLTNCSIPFMISSHKPEQIINICDEIVIINQQKIKLGTVSEAQKLQIIEPKGVTNEF